jgi:hypothetical protein
MWMRGCYQLHGAWSAIDSYLEVDDVFAGRHFLRTRTHFRLQGPKENKFAPYYPDKFNLAISFLEEFLVGLIAAALEYLIRCILSAPDHQRCSNQITP